MLTSRNFESSADEFVGHAPVGYLWETSVRCMTFHVLEVEMLDTHIGIHVKHFVEFAYNERK